MSENIGELILRDMQKWTAEKQTKIEKAAKNIQNTMKQRLDAETPVEKYPYNGGVKRRIVVHAGKGYKAVRENAKYQPGTMKQGWMKSRLTLGGNKVYAVRNKAMPTTVHLANFEHYHYTHGKNTGLTRKTDRNSYGFVSKIQEDGEKELGKEIEKILNE